jgi:diaminohydroxyphosphoribosylaminopyrimidine deaminase/5-amino-6-(5-phosphoribosylamino)uracil reductase
MSQSEDQKWMARALVLAEKGRGKVHPNPLVGAVLVRGASLVAEGYHHAFGQPHAEVDALRKAGTRARGSTLYVTLEPCSHWGKTPPCAEAVIQAGVTRVVAAMRDPNPQVAGRGFKALRKKGIRVTVGVLEKEAREMNRSFVMWVTQHRPYVTIKIASSLDGKTTTARGASHWITGAAARQQGHHWRAHVDAVAVGVRTVLIDNPQLTSHGQGVNPIRVIFDSRLRTPLTAHVLGPQAPTIIVTTISDRKRWNVFEKRGARILSVSRDSQGRANLSEAMKGLAHQGITHMLVEGGATLHGTFFDAGLVDEVLIFLAPKIIGGEAATSSIGGKGILTLSESWNLKNMQFGRVGEDVWIYGKVER